MLCAMTLLVACSDGDDIMTDDVWETDDGSGSPSPIASAKATSEPMDESSTTDPIVDTTTDPHERLTTTGEDSSGDESPPDRACDRDEDCDNGTFCDGTEQCVDGSCVSGDPVDCGEGNECTSLSCDEELRECVLTADDSLCECGETCDRVFGCGVYCTPPDCPDPDPLACDG
jgi:hypothetical protein